MSSPVPAPDSRTLVLHGTEHCHLCEEAVAVLQSVPMLHDWYLEWVDIAEDDALMAEFGPRIPVLHWPAGQVYLDWPFDGDDVARALGLG